jgi:hypothetical protein
MLIIYNWIDQNCTKLMHEAIYHNRVPSVFARQYANGFYMLTCHHHQMTKEKYGAFGGQNMKSMHL